MSARVCQYLLSFFVCINGLRKSERKSEMNKEIVKIVASEQDKMHKAIRDALQSFTERTGMTVASVDFAYAQANDADGNAMAIEYYGVHSCVRVP